MFVMFVFAAIMTSVMVFHWRSQSEMRTNASGNVLLFPEAREMKDFNLVTANNTKFNLDSLRNHWSLVFFGFTHCESICPTTLAMMDKVYPDLHKAYPGLQVVFVSLDPQRDTIDAVTHYAQSFNPGFIGVTGKLEEIRKLQSQVGIYSALDQPNMTGNYQIQHTASIILIDPTGKWSGLFKYGMKPDEFKQVFESAVKG